MTRDSKPGAPVGAAVEVVRTDGGYTVSRDFTSHAAAQRAVDALLAINEAAFVPAPMPASEMIFAYGPAIGGRIIR